LKRCQRDLEAYNAAIKNHPTPEFNIRGEPQWNGSVAQKLLKEAILKGEHDVFFPQGLWEQTKEYQVYSLRTFRDHIYQEQRLLKFRNYVQQIRKRKFDELQY
jgi:hypothetical protein